MFEDQDPNGINQHEPGAMMDKGKLIVFEGGEGSGKSLQCLNLQSWLTASSCGKPHLPSQIPAVATTKEPGGTTLGGDLRSILLDMEEPLDNISELLLYAADRAQHVATFIRPHLDQGALVLCDRYTASTLAYQGYGRGLDLGVIKHLNNLATGGLTPDLTLWLDVDAATGLARAKGRDEACDRMEANDLAFHERVRQGFRMISEHDASMVRVDANQDIQTVFHQIQGIVSKQLTHWY